MWKRLRQWLAPSAQTNEKTASGTERFEPDPSISEALQAERFNPTSIPALGDPPAEALEAHPDIPLHAPEPAARPLETTASGTPAAQVDSNLTSTPQTTAATVVPPAMTLVHVFATRQDATPPSFPCQLTEHAAIANPGHSEPLQHLMHYVQGANPADMGPLRVQLYRHLQRVHHMWRLEVPQDQLDAMGQWASDVNAVLALPDGSVRDPKGYVLLAAPGGREDELARIPHPEEAWNRKRRSETLMLERQLSPNAELPPIASETEIDLRSAQEAAGRMLALLLVAARADLLSSPHAEELNPHAFEERLPQALAYLSPQEKAFMAEPAPSQTLIQSMTWRYEAMITLMWALALVEDLEWPAQVGNIAELVQQILTAGADDLLQNALLRPSSELLDQLDLHLRLHALAREAELHNRLLPQLNRSIIMERHHTLNWLIGHEHADWDKVSTPTS